MAFAVVTIIVVDALAGLLILMYREIKNRLIFGIGEVIAVAGFTYAWFILAMVTACATNNRECP